MFRYDVGNTVIVGFKRNICSASGKHARLSINYWYWNLY